MGMEYLTNAALRAMLALSPTAAGSAFQRLRIFVSQRSSLRTERMEEKGINASPGFIHIPFRVYMAVTILPTEVFSFLSFSFFFFHDE